MENNVSVLDQGLAATNALYYNAAVVVIVVLFAALSWFITTKVRKSDTLKAKLNEFGYDESHFEKLVLGAIMHAEKLATMAAKKAIDKNTHSIDFLKTVDPELIDKYGEQVKDIVSKKASELGKVGWTDTDGDGVLDTPPAK